MGKNADFCRVTRRSLARTIADTVANWIIFPLMSIYMYFPTMGGSASGATLTTVQVGTHEFKVRAGEELILSNADVDAMVASSNPLASVGLRAQTRTTLEQGIQAVLCEFSLPAAIANLHSLKALSQSEISSERTLHQNMIKRAVVLQVVSARRGAYRSWAQ
jgi:hypothetical protein